MKKRREVSTIEFHWLLLEAAETERRLPKAFRPAHITYWPDIQAEWLAYADKETTTRLARATAKQIDDYAFVSDVVLNAPLDANRKLMWGVAHSAAFRERGPNWTNLSKILNCARRTVKSNYEAALHETVWIWNKQV